MLEGSGVWNSQYNGYEKEAYIKKVKNNADGKSFTIELSIVDKVNNAILYLINSNEEFVKYFNSPERSQDIINGVDMNTKPYFRPQNAIKSQEYEDNFFLENIKVENISYDPDFKAGLNMISGASAAALKSVSLATMVFSMSSSIALIKIFQMMDFMLFFSVLHPKNFQLFLELFNSNFLNDFPNIFAFCYDDNCGEMREKFVEEEMSCQFLSNCG